MQLTYENIVEGFFVSRQNRFIATVEVNGKKEICHVKNTGRLKELLTLGAKVYLEKSSVKTRKTQYDLIAVIKDSMLINIDSQAPNKVFGEWVKSSGYFKDITLIKPECKYKNSRFDYYIETKDEKIFVEVKGVTLENDGVISFPDAPTTRGVKHINELRESIKEGFSAYVFFICQMEKAKYFVPNRKTHPEFADALKCAKESGVNVKCLNCIVTPNSLSAKDFVDVVL